MVTEGFLVLWESGFQPYREYILERLARRHRLWLFDSRQPSWELPYLAGHTTVDTKDVYAALPAARELHERQRIAGILCYDELHIVAAAHVAAALGLPGAGPRAALACRDKLLTRRLLDRAGVAQPRSLCVGDLESAVAAAQIIGYPVIIKPRGLAGSVGVSLVDKQADLAEAVALAKESTFPGVTRHRLGILVEEYVSGPEISVDSLVCEGHPTPVIIAHKSQDLKPTFEETGHLVLGDDPLLRDEPLLDVLTRVHRAVGFGDGTSHVELRLTGQGPKVIEVNGRFGGDLIPYVGQLANGVDLPVLAAEIACGRRPEPVSTRNCVAGIRWLYPPHDMRLTEAQVIPSALPPGLWELTVIARPGQKLSLPPRQNVFGRLGLAIAIAQTPEMCRQTLDLAPHALQAQGVPLPDRAAGRIT